MPYGGRIKYQNILLKNMNNGWKIIKTRISVSFEKSVMQLFVEEYDRNVDKLPKNMHHYTSLMRKFKEKLRE